VVCVVSQRSLSETGLEPLQSRDAVAFATFAQAVDASLWLSGVTPPFALEERSARWSCAPYAAELRPAGAARARIVLFAYGRPCYVSQPGAMTLSGARTLAHAVGMLFAGRRSTSLGDVRRPMLLT
jgi:hypothetical protein